MLARLTIDAKDENFEETMDKVQKAISGVNLTCKVKR
jgi:hypothetical protein